MSGASYDESAGLYDAAFADITVRKLEWDWVVAALRKVAARLGRLPEVLEIGCGNGQLLRQLLDAGVIGKGTGVDVSESMLGHAMRRHEGVADLDFQQIEGPDLPFKDGSFDVVISFLSFRYLDWVAVADEIARVGAVFLMVDMAATVLEEKDRELYEETRRRTEKLHAERPAFSVALRNLVDHPSWHEMLRRHPRISATKYEEFLTSRFPQGNWERLYVCGDHSLFTFEAGQ